MDTYPINNPVLKFAARPVDANSGGDMFGGWLMSQMDIAGAIATASITESRFCTGSVEKLRFIKPIMVHDYVEIHAKISEVKAHSVRVEMEVLHTNRANLGSWQQAATGVYVYVAISRLGKACKLELRAPS